MKHKIIPLLSAAVMTVTMLPSVPMTVQAADYQEKFNKDGYDVTVWNAHNSGDVDFQYTKDGGFNLDWYATDETWILSGKILGSKMDYTQYGNIVLDYSLDYTPEGGSYIGYNIWAEQCQGPHKVAQFYIIEGWCAPSCVMDYFDQEGTIEVDGVTYDVYSVLRNNYPTIIGVTESYYDYYCIRQDSEVASGTEAKLSGTVYFSEFFDAFNTLGLETSGKLYSIQFCLDTYRCSGSLEVTKNNYYMDSLNRPSKKTIVNKCVDPNGTTPAETTTTEITTTEETTTEETTTEETTTEETTTEETTTELTTTTTTVVVPSVSDHNLVDMYGDSFRVGATIGSDGSFELAKNLLNQFNYFRLGDCIMPDTMLDQEASAKTGTVQVSLHYCEKILKYCEDNQIPVHLGPAVCYSQTPQWFFKEDFRNTGAYVSAEEMTKRLEEYIKGTFEALKENYPKLIVDAYTVCSEVISDYVSETDTDVLYSTSDQFYWMKVYGNSDFVFEAFKLARKYAPTGCKLYYEDYNESLPARTKAIIMLAEQLKKQNLIDGIAMEGYLANGYATPDNYESAIKEYAELGLDLQITQAWGVPKKLSRTQKEMTLYDIMHAAEKYADVISAVSFCQPMNGAWDVNYNSLDQMCNEVIRKDTFYSYGDDAQGSGIDVKLMPSGDANVDNQTDISDAILLCRYAASDNVKITAEGLANSDMNRDGKYTSEDVVIIIKKIARLI